MIVTMPGKLGDALYCLPTINKIYHRTNDKITFWTSPYCSPLKTLFEAQESIERVVIDESYIRLNDDCGTQPWRMFNAEQEDEMVIHCGFKKAPNCAIPFFIMREAGITEGIWEEETEDSIEKFMKLKYPGSLIDSTDYIILAPKTLNSGFQNLWRELVKRYKVVSIGKEEEYFPGTIDCTGIDFLATCSLIANAKVFVGTFSAMLALANFFKTPKIVPYDARWAMTHGMNSPTYLREPSMDEFIETIDKIV